MVKTKSTRRLAIATDLTLTSTVFQSQSFHPQPTFRYSSNYIGSSITIGPRLTQGSPSTSSTSSDGAIFSALSPQSAGCAPSSPQTLYPPLPTSSAGHPPTQTAISIPSSHDH